MIPFCGLVEGFRDPRAVASLSYDQTAQEFESLLRSSRANLQGLARLLPALSKTRLALASMPLLSQDRRFLAWRAQQKKIEAATEWIEHQTLCRDFDKKVLPYAFAFARERAREAAKLAQGEPSKLNDSQTNARLARFMAHDWVKETGHASKNPFEQIVLQELAQVKQWIERSEESRNLQHRGEMDQN